MPVWHGCHKLDACFIFKKVQYGLELSDEVAACEDIKVPRSSYRTLS